MAIKVDVNNGKKKFSNNRLLTEILYSYEFDRMSNPGSGRSYHDSGYQQQQRGETYNNQQPRRSNNYASGNGNSRGRRGAGGNVYRGGTQSDAGTGGKCEV